MYRLLRVGVPLQAIIGDRELPGSMGDWLIEFDNVYRAFDLEQQAQLAGAKET